MSPPDLMGFDFLGLTIGTSTTTIATLSGTGIVSFNATFGTDYSANVSGVGGGSQGTGMFGLLIEPAGSPIPEPSTILLFGTGLVGLAAVRRKGK